MRVRARVWVRVRERISLCKKKIKKNPLLYSILDFQVIGLLYKMLYIGYYSLPVLFFDMQVKKEDAKRLVTNRRNCTKQADYLKIEKKKEKQIRLGFELGFGFGFGLGSGLGLGLGLDERLGLE